MKGYFLRTIITIFLKRVVFFGLVTLPVFAFAQAPQRGKVEIDKDSKVDSLIGNYLVGAKTNQGTTGGSGGGISSSDGYRVQIFSGADRKEAFSVQAKFQDRHPDMRSYLSYKAPNFKVHVGDFRSRLEAEKAMDEFKNSFNGMFIIPEKINNTKFATE